MNRRALLMSLAGAVASPAVAQSAYPDRPVRLVVPFAPGGGTDIAARVVGELLGALLGQPIVVDNRPGANGAIAGEIVARAAPDGHTLLVATASGFAAAPALGQRLPYDVERDFVVIGPLGLFPLVINVHPSVRAQTMQEFVALAKASPGALNYGSPGHGSANQLLMELISDMTGISLTHVPYRGVAPASVDLMAGQIQAMVEPLAASLGNIRAQRVRALAVTTAERQQQIPGVPTLREQSIDLVYPGWTAIAGPAALPAAVVDRLSRALIEVQNSEALRRRYAELVIEPAPWDPARMTAFIAEDRRMLTRIISARGIRAE